MTEQFDDQLLDEYAHNFYGYGNYGGQFWFIGVVASIPFTESTVISPAILIMAAPQIVSGALFFAAGMLARRATTSGKVGI